MYIKSLYLKNFMNIREVSLEFPQGIIVLYGGNGSGKSSILEALAFCLVERRRGDSWKEYIRSGEKSFIIKLNLLKGGEEVSFHFVGEKKSGNVQKIITYKGIVYQNAAANDFIKEILDAQMVENIIFTMQDGPPITRLIPLERRNIFKKIFNTDFSEILEKLKEEELKFQETIKVYQQKVSALQTKHYPFLRLIDVNIEKLAFLQKTLEEKELLSQQESSRFKLFENLRQEQASYDSIQRSFSIVEQAIQKEYQALHVLEQQLEEEKILKNQILQQQEEIHALFSRQYAPELLQEKEKNLFSYEEQLKKVLLQIQEKQNYLSLKNLHLQTHKEGRCDKCGNICDPKNIKILEEEIEKLSNELSQYQEQYKEIENLYFTFKQEIEIFLKEKRNIEIKQSEFAHQLDLITKTQEKYQNSLQIIQGNISRLRKEKEEYEKKLQQTTTIINSLQAELASYPSFLNQDIKELEEEIRVITEQIQELEKELLINKEREKINNNLYVQKQKDEEEITRYLLEISEYQRKIEENQLLRRIFEIDFPNFINMKTSKILQDFMNSILQTVKDGLQVWLQQTKKGIDFYYKTSSSDWMNAKLASGFETSLLTFAFKCAVARAYNSQLLVLDEPDHAATEASSVKFFETLVTVVGGFNQIFIITHRPEALDFLISSGAHVYEVKDGEFYLL